MVGNPSRTYRLMAAAAVVGLLAVGCGSSDPEGSDGSSTTSEASKKTTTTTTEGGEPDDGNKVDGAGGLVDVLTEEGATKAFAEPPENVLVEAFGIPPEMAAIDGKLRRVSVDYHLTASQIPGETYSIRLIQDLPFEEAAKGIRTHFADAGFTYTDSSTLKDMTGTLESDRRFTLGITVEEETADTTLVELLLSHTGQPGDPPAAQGSLFAFVENLKFDDAMVFNNADATIDSGEGGPLGDTQPSISFSALYNVPADGYEDAKASLEQVCAGAVDGYGCSDAGVEPQFHPEDGVKVAEFESPDQLTFDLTLTQVNVVANPTPSYFFDYVGPGFED